MIAFFYTCQYPAGRPLYHRIALAVQALDIDQQVPRLHLLPDGDSAKAALGFDGGDCPRCGSVQRTLCGGDFYSLVFSRCALDKQTRTGKIQADPAEAVALLQRSGLGAGKNVLRQKCSLADVLPRQKLTQPGLSFRVQRAEVDRPDKAAEEQYEQKAPRSPHRQTGAQGKTLQKSARPAPLQKAQRPRTVLQQSLQAQPVDPGNLRLHPGGQSADVQQPDLVQ